MPAPRISVGLVVKPEMRASRYSASIPSRLAPSAKILTRRASTPGVDERAAGSGAVIVIVLHLGACRDWRGVLAGPRAGRGVARIVQRSRLPSLYRWRHGPGRFAIVPRPRRPSPRSGATLRRRGGLMTIADYPVDSPARQMVRRSSLIMPVNVSAFVEKAHLRGADAICLDLEDSVPPREKDRARTLVKDAIPKAGRGGADVTVRINRPWELGRDDLDAVIWPGLAGISFPKPET